MIELIKELQGLLVKERARAVERGHAEVFNSNHEAYAVILEEYQEAYDEVERFDEVLEMVWKNNIRKDEDAFDEFIELRDMALRGCAELLQVATMCQKSADSEMLR